MKQYEKPTLETITLTQDVITASEDPGPKDCIKICDNPPIDVCIKICEQLDVCKKGY